MEQPIIAIGDVHGRLDLLQSLVSDLRSQYERFTLVTLGDYIDRGPESAGVIDFLLNPPPGVHLRPLMGNHEQLMLAALSGTSGAAVDNWLHNGGVQTIESYGLDSQGCPKVPREHIEFLETLPAFFDDGKRLYVHAGVDPAKPLEEQELSTLLWIRRPFLDRRHCIPRVVVHGHTPNKQGPEHLEWRINLDTGAFATGRLSAAIFEPGKPEPLFHVVTDRKPEAFPSR